MKFRDLVACLFYSSKSTVIGQRPKLHDLDHFFKNIHPQTTEHELVRIGGEGDGGYLVPNDLEGIGAVLSPGVDQTADFETYFANKGIPCFLADYSVDKPPVIHPNFHFLKKYIGKSNSDTHITLQSWTESISQQHKGDLLLQMDIEGAEIDALLLTDSKILRLFRIVAVEFHDMDMIYHKYGLKVLELVFDKLLAEFVPVHIHPNNCANFVHWRGYSVPRFLEMTFLRRDRFQTAKPATTFPHLLDRPCVNHQPDPPLPQCWYGKRPDSTHGSGISA